MGEQNKLIKLLNIQNLPTFNIVHEIEQAKTKTLAFSKQ